MFPHFFIWLLISIVIAITIVIYGTPKLVEIAKLKHLFDDPQDERKIHDRNIPNIGGIVIVTAIILAFSVTTYAEALPGYQYVIISLIILLIIGVKDDLLLISPFKKLLAQIIVATFMIFGAGITVKSFGGVFGVYELPYLISVKVSYLFYVMMINAINLIDGIDGLAASIILLVTTFFGGWFLLAGNGHYHLSW